MRDEMNSCSAMARLVIPCAASSATSRSRLLRATAPVSSHVVAALDAAPLEGPSGRGRAHRGVVSTEVRAPATRTARAPAAAGRPALCPARPACPAARLGQSVRAATAGRTPAPPKAAAAVAVGAAGPAVAVGAPTPTGGAVPAAVAAPGTARLAPSSSRGRSPVTGWWRSPTSHRVTPRRPRRAPRSRPRPRRPRRPARPRRGPWRLRPASPADAGRHEPTHHRGDPPRRQFGLGRDGRQRPPGLRPSREPRGPCQRITCLPAGDRAPGQRCVRTETPGRSRNPVMSALTTMRSEALAVAAMMRSWAPRGLPIARTARRSSACLSATPRS